MENKSTVFNIISIASIAVILNNVLMFWEIGVFLPSTLLIFYPILFLTLFVLGIFFLRKKQNILSAILFIFCMLLLAGWMIFLPENIIQFFPVLFLTLLVLGIFSLRKKQNVLATISFVTSVLLFSKWIFILPENFLVLFSPILFLIPLVFSIFSLKNKENTLAKILLAISSLSLVIAGIFCVYAYLLGSSWTI